MTANALHRVANVTGRVRWTVLALLAGSIAFWWLVGVLAGAW